MAVWVFVDERKITPHRLLLLEPRLFEDTDLGAFGQIFFGMWYSHAPRLGRMLELMMGASHSNQHPTVSFKDFDECATVHAQRIHT